MNKRIILLILMFCITVYSKAQTAMATLYVLPQDSIQLVALFNNNNGANWSNNSGWLSGNVKNWFGVNGFGIDEGEYYYCVTPEDQEPHCELYFHVSSIKLPGNNLTGLLPKGPMIESLGTINLSNNFFYDSIPSSWGNEGISKIQISHNNLYGSIPASLGNEATDHIDLSYNQLSGDIPNALFISRENAWLDLSHNHLIGGIPEDITIMEEMEHLDLSHNMLSGPIPVGITRLIENGEPLESLDISNNNFNFDGMELLAQRVGFAVYAPQANLKINKRDTLLSVTAGGTLSNNTYKWYLNNNMVATIVGDSTFKPIEEGNYSVQIKNSIATALTLGSDTIAFFKIKIIDPNPSIVRTDGTLDITLSNLDTTKIVKGAATDGITKLLLHTWSPVPIKFTINGDNNGHLKELGSTNDTLTEITITPDGNNRVVALYTVPDGIGGTNANDRKITISVAALDNSNQSVLNLTLASPPVVLVHGMWSSPSVWTKDKFDRYLRMHGFKTQSADYSEEANCTFDPLNNESVFGRAAVLQAIVQGLKDYENRKIAVAQVDVIGHSLGGLMTRSFAQTEHNFSKRNYKEGYIHKLITLGTPHFGSPLGPILYNKYESLRLPTSFQSIRDFYNLSDKVIFQYLYEKFATNIRIGSAHRDFDPTYPALKNLKHTNDESVKIRKVHAIVGIILPSWATYGWEKFIRLIARRDLHIILQVGAHDLIVSEQSQLGGLNYGRAATSFQATAHSNPPGSSLLGFTTETSNANIMNKVRDLLLTSDNSNFANGFPSPAQFLNRPSSIYEEEQSRSLDIHNINDSALIRLTDNSKNIIVDSSTNEIVISFDTLNGAVISDPVCLIQGIGIFAFPDQAPYSITIPFVEKKNLGQLKFCVLARNNTDALLCDTSAIFLKAQGNFIRLDVDTSSLELDSTIRQTKINAFAVYNQSGTEVNYSLDSSSGINFTSYSNRIHVDKNGVLKGISGGNDTVIVSYNSQTIKVPVKVIDGFESLSKYQTTISFDIENKQSLDLPFILSGTSSSGEILQYTLIGGPIELQKEIVNIEGAGIATIRAFSPANSYFDSSSVTISFTITQSTPITYTFIGQGNWSNNANWSNNLIPPSILPSGSEIIINPSNEGECVVDVEQRIGSGAKFTLLNGKKIRVLTNLIIQH